jgi:sialic acid synthase SpsE
MMKIGRVNLDEKVFVVAEIGNNHEGNFSAAQELIGRAVEAGVDAVKFQTFIPELYVSQSEPERLARLRKFRLTFDQFEQLAKLALRLGVIFFSTPFDLESARFLNTIQPLFKIASGDNTFYPLIQEVAQYGKPMLVSTGISDLATVRRVSAAIRTVWANENVDPGLAFLHCVSSYPVPLNHANLGAIHVLKAEFPSVVIGYSDHTSGIETATYAVAAGARIVEKHFTLNKAYSDFRDHQLSADPEEMRRLVEAIRIVTTIMGSGRKEILSCEEAGRLAARRSIAASQNLSAGRRIERHDLTWVRPGTGFAPGEEDRLIGFRLRRSLKMGELILNNDIET